MLLSLGQVKRNYSSEMSIISVYNLAKCCEVILDDLVSRKSNLET